MKSVKLQHRTYLGKGKKIKYLQHRVNIPHEIIRKLNWIGEFQIILHANTKKKIIILEELKTKTG